MENVKTFFDSFKEFVWDIIGYLLPGSYLLILLSSIINKKYFINPHVGNSLDDLRVFNFIIISYILGYALYGLGYFKEKILKSYSYTKKIETQVSSRKAFILAKEMLSKNLSAKGITDDLSTATLRDIRSIAMSSIPEHDQKIYTFTFRSDLANQIANISIIAGSMGLWSKYIGWPTGDIFQTEGRYIILYFILIFSYFLLREARNRFYAISMSLPFSIYLAKALGL